MNNLVAIWNVCLSDGTHKIEFEHGTTTGKRIIKVDGREVFRKDWMFRLVGSECFNIGKAKCVIHIIPLDSFTYEYSLEVNGKSYEKFRENQSKVMKTWFCKVGQSEYRIVLERDTLDIWINGDKQEAVAEFSDEGTETHLDINGCPAVIKAVSSGSKREGIVYSLIINDRVIPEAVE